MPDFLYENEKQGLQKRTMTVSKANTEMNLNFIMN